MDVTNSSSKMDKYWVDSPNPCHYDRNLNFAAIGSEDDEAYSSFSKKPKSARDPQSHRIIEKRRRDRMNNCLADLSRLLPVAYMKKGRGRIEKTEIIEMTIKHMKHLQVHACKEMDTCEIAVQMEQLHSNTKSDQYRSGFLECISETVKFIGHHQSDHHHASALFTGEDFCSRLVAHLHNHYDKISRSDGTGSETGDYPVGVSAASLATRTGQANGAGPPASEEEETLEHLTVSTSCVPPEPADQYKSANETELTESDKIKDDRVKEMFNYLNGSGEHHHRQQHQQQQQQEQQQQQLHSSGRPERSSSGSGGDSDESRSNRATRNSDTPSPVHPTTDASSPTDMEYNSSHSGGSNHSSSRSGNSSQLRQMLLASNGESSGTTSRTKSCSSSGSSRSNTTQLSTEDSNNMYKFKTNIHQRFTADLEHVFVPQSSCLMTPSSTSSLPEQQQQQQQQQQIHQSSHHSQQTISFEQGHGLKRKMSDYERHNHVGYGWNADVLPTAPIVPSRSPRLHCDETEEPTIHLNTSINHHQHQQPATSGVPENVPIFALHPKGAFYVPMSVELPLIQGLFNLPSSTENAQPLLHPVTISVNFCHPLRVLTTAMVAAVNSGTTSIQHSSVIQPPVRIPRPELVLPGLLPVPPNAQQRHHHPYEMDPSASNASSNSGSSSNSSSHSYPQIVADESGRQRSREHTGRSMGRHHEELKIFRPPQREEMSGYSNGARDYAVIRSSSREHSARSQQPVIATAPHSSRWSHLMAKRTHTP